MCQGGNVGTPGDWAVSSPTNTKVAAVKPLSADGICGNWNNWVRPQECHKSSV